MTGDASKFTHISPKNNGHVTYGDNNKGKILGVGKIGTNPSTSIENVLLVDGLKHSLLSVSQLCDKGFLVSFDSHNCFIENKHDKCRNLPFDGRATRGLTGASSKKGKCAESPPTFVQGKRRKNRK